MTEVAYLITYISYSYIINKKGSIEESELENFILDEVSDYIINNSASKKFESSDDVKKFWKKYGDYLVWEASYVKNNKWINIKLDDGKILDKILGLIRTNSYVNLEEIDLSEIDLDKNTFDEIDLGETEFKEINSDIEPNWEKIAYYEMNNSTELHNDY